MGARMGTQAELAGREGRCTLARVAAGMDGLRLWPAQAARARRPENDPTPF
jgi:hypothetical protein